MSHAVIFGSSLVIMQLLPFFTTDLLSPSDSTLCYILSKLMIVPIKYFLSVQYIIQNLNILFEGNISSELTAPGQLHLLKINE